MSEHLTPGPPRILLVDDDVYVRRLMRRILYIEGYDFIAAGTAQEAREILASAEVSLVISDIHMPGESGLDLVQHQRHLAPRSVFIMVSGYGAGYPSKLAGAELPIEARIISIVYDALTHEDEVIEYMGQRRGRQFDPDPLDLFLSNPRHHSSDSTHHPRHTRSGPDAASPRARVAH